MQKLLAAYEVSRTLENACRLRAYKEKHPMAVCMLTPLENCLLDAAVKHANNGVAP